MLLQQDIDFVDERKARQKIRFLIDRVRSQLNDLTNEELVKASRVITLTQSIAQELGLQNDLIEWAKIHQSNNTKYVVRENAIPTLDAMADLDDLIADAGHQLQIQSQK